MAGDGRRPLAEPRRRASARPGKALCLGWPGRARPWADALLGHLPSLALGPRRPVVAVGQFVSTGWPSNV